MTRWTKSSGLTWRCKDYDVEAKETIDAPPSFIFKKLVNDVILFDNQ
jgi:hypothetical protein